ncbi:MAG: hypothetical protein MJ240_01320 [Kiritimatiellae bacterium]|nr:hypothetical protein [Kiritimatiellia bacterium]
MGKHLPNWLVMCGLATILAAPCPAALFRGLYAPPDPPPSNRVAALSALTAVRPAEAQVVRRAGVPTLLVDGVPTPFNAYKGDYDYRLTGEAGATIVITHNSGGRLYASVNWDKALWDAARGTFDFSRIETNLLRIHQANPRARVILALNLNPDRAFLEAHPDEIFVDDQGRRGRIQLEAFRGFGNEPLPDDVRANWAYAYTGHAWRAYVEKGLTALGNWLRTTPAGNIVIGFQLGGGMDGQFVQWEYKPTHGHFDYSEGNRRALVDYLRERYVTDAALQRAWGDPNVTLATARNPSPAAFAAHPVADDQPGEGRHLADCRRFIAVGTARTLNSFARTIKAAFGRPCVVQVWWTTAIWAQPSRLALDDLLRGEAINIVGTVSYYGAHRALSGAGASANNLAAALDARNVLYVQELDYRTRRTQHVGAATMQAAAIPSTARDFDLQVMRDAGSVLASGGHGFYFYDMFGSWYHEPEAKATLRKAYAMNAFARRHEGEYSRREVALVMDEATRLLAEKEAYATPNGVWRTSGVMPALHLLSDVTRPDFPDYKLLILWSPVSLTASQAAEVRRRSARGLVVVAGAAGVSSRDFGTTNAAWAALGPKVRRIESVGEITPSRLNELAQEAGAHVYAAPGNAVYVGNGVAVVHRLTPDMTTVDFGRTVVPVDPLTGVRGMPLRHWAPTLGTNENAVICYELAP